MQHKNNIKWNQNEQMQLILYKMSDDILSSYYTVLLSIIEFLSLILHVPNQIFSDYCWCC